MIRDETLYLKDILLAIEGIEEFVKDMTYDDFIHYDRTYSAVIRKLKLIGEATKKISDFEISCRINPTLLHFVS
jgi:uncharacterized protein with HEPN domain